MKELLRSRRGVAIELAIGVMFLMIAFTIMLLSTAGLQNSHRNDDYKDFNEKVEIYNITDYILANPGADSYNDYNISKVGEKYTVTDSENNTILEFAVDANGKISSWN